MIGRVRPARWALAMAVAAVTLLRAQAPAAAPSVALPFTVSLGEAFAVDGLPGLHSYAFGTLGDRVIVVGGRTTGLHGFGTDENVAGNFPDAGVNGYLWVVDLALRRATAIPIAPFEPPLLRDQLSATNQEFAQDGNTLYVVGGYGRDSADNTFKTFPSMTAIDLQSAIDRTTAAAGAAAMTRIAAKFPDDERFRVTGGALFQVNHQFFLAFGQVFDRAYTPAPRATASFTQIYTESVRMFTMSGTPPAPIWQSSFPVAPALNHDFYHRRDFPSALTIGPSGAPRISVFGGVFRMGSPDPHVDVLHIDGLNQPSPTLTEDPMPVAMNQYVCPTLTLTGGAAAGRAFTILFGGLSAFRYDSAAKQLVSNLAQTDHGADSLGFVDDISGIVLNPSGAYDGFVLGLKMPGLLGTSASLIPRPGFENGLVDLSTLTAPTTVGYIFGGIAANALHAGAAGTRASNLFIPVIVTPAASNAAVMPAIPVTAVTP